MGDVMDSAGVPHFSGLRLDALRLSSSTPSSPSSAMAASYSGSPYNLSSPVAVAKQPFVIGVSGGTASGKTTVCDMIIQQLHDHRVVLVNQDSFYRGLTAEESEHVQDYNFDHPDAFDTEQLLEYMNQLKCCQSVNVPIYDFKNHRRCSESFRKVNASDVIILEGILAFHDQRVRDLMDMKIFVDTDADIRLARRIRRDTVERGRDVNSVLEQDRQQIAFGGLARIGRLGAYCNCTEHDIGESSFFLSKQKQREQLELEVEEQAAMDGDGEVCKMEGETRRRRKGKERAENQEERNQQQKNYFLEDESEEHHFNPFLSSSPNSSNSSLPKTQIRTEVSRARWIEEIGMGEVIEKKGSLWGTTGVIRNSKLYCHIEEIGFLAQIGALVLLDEGDNNIMDLTDIFRKCASKRYGCTWDSFEAYRHLKSLGYVVGRHGQPWSLKLDKVNSNSDLTADPDPDLIAGQVEELHIGAANLIFDIHRPNSRFKKTDPGVPSFVICLVGDRPPSRKEVEDLEKRCKSVPLKFCHVKHDNGSQGR